MWVQLDKSCKLVVVKLIEIFLHLDVRCCLSYLIYPHYGKNSLHYRGLLQLVDLFFRYSCHKVFYRDLQNSNRARTNDRELEIRLFVEKSFRANPRASSDHFDRKVVKGFRHRALRKSKADFFASKRHGLEKFSLRSHWFMLQGVLFVEDFAGTWLDEVEVF